MVREVITVMNEDQMVHTTAIVALVLGRTDLDASTLRERYGVQTLPTLLDGMLVDLESAVQEQGKYDLPPLVDGTMLARLLQLEIGANVDVIHTSPAGVAGYRQYLVSR